MLYKGMNMKKAALSACVCILVFCAVCTGCGNANGVKPKPQQNSVNPPTPSESAAGTSSKPEEIIEKVFSELPAAHQAEIKRLYGYYWAKDGSRSECPAINAERLAVYTGQQGMSIGFTNLRWRRVSAAKWECFAYAEEDVDCDEKRIIFTFEKDSNGTVQLVNTIIRMSNSFGPYIKGKEPEKVVAGGKTYYRYDSKSPKLVEPTLK